MSKFPDRQTAPEKLRPGGAGSHRVNYLRLSVTDRCDFHCRYCMPPGGLRPAGTDEILTGAEILRFATAAVRAGITRVRITGGEPLLRRGLQSLIAGLAEIGGICDLALTTNGSMLRKQALDLKNAGLMRVNISIDSLDPARFSRITGGASLRTVLAGLEAALDAGLQPVKVNAVMLAGIESDLSRFVALIRELPVHVRFIELMPVRESSADGGFVSSDRIFEMLTGYGSLKPATPPAGAGPARYFRLAGAAGTIGFISPVSHHFCGSCNRLRLTADGRLLGCLFADADVSIRPYLVDGDALTRLIAGTIAGKRYNGMAGSLRTRMMSRIGG